LNSFYSIDELRGLGFKRFGQNVLISRKASIYGAESMTIGNDVRIDDFCIISGKITIGNYVHISAYTAMYGGDKGITIHDFCSISSRTAVYSVTDDYSGEAMTNPMVPARYRKVQSEEVVVEKHTIIGSGCVVLPGVVLKEGSSFGAMTLINSSSEPWSINTGIPYKKIKDRSRELLNMEKEFLLEVNE
jgi:galactoside O-acetyltransferase